MISIWSDSIEFPSFEQLKKDIKTDVLIIGGGITGILCAYMLEQAGIDYVLVEADELCSGITKNTTAKISIQHGLIYHKLVKRFGLEMARMYLDANVAALQEYSKLCENIDCHFEVKDSLVYSLNSPTKLEKELHALNQLGYTADYVGKLPIPLANAGAVRFENQAQFHPLKFLAEICKRLSIYEHTKVRELMPNTAMTAHGRITAQNIIVTTHFPFLNKHGSYFLKMYQHRSYVIAYENAPDVKGMYVDEADKGLSFRNYNNLLLIGGGDHRTGKHGGNWKEISEFATAHYPDAQARYYWATQDCMTLDEVPYIGQYSKRTENLYVATGFNKWGMTSAMTAAMLLRDIITKKECPYAPVFSPSRTMLRTQLFINAFEATTNLLTPTTKRCPHLGCALKWNPQERSWDCPCHGSRFTENGELIDNPATGDLNTKSLS
ncbi:MAG: FAD-dependent oxidoreductase [Tyzzerella sp.]|nr:FAD-dependent oxidoreductase [Tyzzerella sp.]